MLCDLESQKNQEIRGLELSAPPTDLREGGGSCCRSSSIKSLKQNLMSFWERKHMEMLGGWHSQRERGTYMLPPPYLPMRLFQLPVPELYPFINKPINLVSKFFSQFCEPF